MKNLEQEINHKNRINRSKLDLNSEEPTRTCTHMKNLQARDRSQY